MATRRTGLLSYDRELDHVSSWKRPIAVTSAQRGSAMSSTPLATQMKQFTRSVQLPVDASMAFSYHERSGALQRLLPPWQQVRVVRSDKGLNVDNQVTLEMRVGGIPLRWLARHTRYEPPHLFEDIQVSGPFAYWRHEHKFAISKAEEEGVPGTLLTDDVHYRLPAGRIGNLLGDNTIRKQLGAMFAYRHAVTQGDLRAISRMNLEPINIGISGAGGMLGTELSSFLSLAGHKVHRLVRGETQKPNEIYAWGNASECEPLGKLDAIVHLAGESIASGRWTDDVKKRIRDSRVEKTRELCQKLAAFPNPPKVLLCASATGYYGDRGEELLNEQSASGEGFLPDVAEQWEESCQPAKDAGIRVVHMRFGIILSPRGGALAKMLLPAKLGVGGPLGDGRQWWSWISIDDAVRATYHCLGSEQLSGPVNFVSPEPTRCAEFAKVVGKVLHRPAFIPTPAFALRLGLGEMADALLLASTRVAPDRLVQTGFEYQFPDLEAALRHHLGKTKSSA